MRERKIGCFEGILFVGIGEFRYSIMVMEIVLSVILLLVGIIFLVIVHVCIVGRAFSGYTNGNIVVQRGTTTTTNASPSMSSDDINKLPCFDYREEDKEKSSLECAVCLEIFKVGDKCRLLPNCRHSFHALCIDSWLLSTAICPVCRTGTYSPKISGQTSNSNEVGVELT